MTYNHDVSLIDIGIMGVARCPCGWSASYYGPVQCSKRLYRQAVEEHDQEIEDDGVQTAHIHA